MSGGSGTFFGVVATRLVENGKDAERELRFNVYPIMLLQIMRDYPSLPDFHTLTASEIKFFYDGLRSELKEHTKSKK